MTQTTACAAIRNAASGPDVGVIFFGGEPLLCEPLIRSTIEWCDAEAPGHYHYKVTTNGTLLTPEFIAWATEHRLHIARSCDGVCAAHEAHRPGRWERVAAILPALLRAQPYADSDNGESRHRAVL